MTAWRASVAREVLAATIEAAVRNPPRAEQGASETIAGIVATACDLADELATQACRRWGCDPTMECDPCFRCGKRER